MPRRRLIGAILALGIITTGILTWTLGGAEGAVAMNRVSTTCAKQGYDASRWRLQVDPVAQYGVPVSAHPHNWFGARGVSSTGISAAQEKAYSDSRGHPEDGGYGPLFSNCPFYGNWPEWAFPTALLNGVELKPGALTVTMQAPVGVQVVAPPFGETFIAGDSHTLGPNPSPHVRFTCGDIDGAASSKPIDCSSTPGGVVTAEITWPDCWDGANNINESPMGISPTHFSYSVNGACPPGSVPCVQGRLMAQDITQETWIDPRTSAPLVNPLNADGTIALTFSSGPYYTYHSDYINLWNHYLADIVQQCLNHGTPGSCPFGTRVGLHNLE